MSKSKPQRWIREVILQQQSINQGISGFQDAKHKPPQKWPGQKKKINSKLLHLIQMN